MTTKNFLNRFLVYCSGVDYSTLMQTTSSEVNKYKIMGTCVLVPAIMALFSGYYSMFLISHKVWLSCLFAPTWATLIFIIDRAVVSGMKPGCFTMGTASRCLLAVLIAFTVAEPFILKACEDSINEKRVFIIEEKKQEIAAHYDNEIAAINNESALEKAKVDALQTSYIQEVDGTGGSRNPFRGPIAKIKEEAYQKALEDFEVKQANRDAQIANIETQRDQKCRTIVEKNTQGLLSDITTLDRLEEENSKVWWVTWLIRILFLAIELIAVLTKLDLPKKSLYHSIVEMREESCLQEQRAIIDLQTQLAIEENKQRLNSMMIRNSINLKLEDFKFALGKTCESKEVFLKNMTQIIEEVEDEELKDGLLLHIMNINDSYMNAMESLIAKMAS